MTVLHILSCGLHAYVSCTTFTL